MLPYAAELEAVDEEFRALLNPLVVQSITSLIPDEWLDGEATFNSPAEHRDAYTHFLNTRIGNSAIFVKEAQHAREAII